MHQVAPDVQATRNRSWGAAAVIVASIGIALLVSVLAANQRWLDRHFLPSFFVPRYWYVLIETTIRILLGALGVLLVLVARPAGDLIMRAPSRVFSIVIAAVLALGASESVLRLVHLQPTEWLLPQEEPRRQPDPRLGWVLVPARTGESTVGGRAIEYVIDAAGYRVRRSSEPVDADQPTIVFTGESVMFGEGLTWEETIPAQVGNALGVQSANLAVHGYSTDQAYLRLQAELTRFKRPLAVVSLFMTSLFGRNLDDDRPRLGPGMIWRPPERHGRLMSLAGLLVPYRRDETVNEGLIVTRQVLRATVDLAGTRRARALIVVPQLGAESPIDRSLRARILDEARLPYAFVPIDAAWRLAWDRHPNAAAARVIATAIADRLRAREP
jgi:hypothetical protein